MKKTLTVVTTAFIVVLLIVNTFLLIRAIKGPDWGKSRKGFAGHWISSSDTNGSGLYIFADGTVALVSTRGKVATADDPYDAYIDTVKIGYIEKETIVLNKTYSFVPQGIGQNYSYYHQIDEIPQELFIPTAYIYSLEKVTKDAMKCKLTENNYISYVRSDDNE